MDDEKRFLAALAADEDDELTRHVYADWLDEHDRPEDADRQRNWADSKRWVRAFADRLGQTYDALMRAATRFEVKGAETPVGMDESNRMCDYDHEWPGFWRHYAILTGRPVGDPDRGEPFVCSC